MSPGIVGGFIGSIAISLGIAAIWLILSMLIPPLRRNPGVSYAVAMALALLVQAVSLDRGNILNWIAALLVVAVLYWQMRRAKAKLASQKPSP
jgi:multisubunit Na+/H+ antiporter MnhE subunit